MGGSLSAQIACIYCLYQEWQSFFDSFATTGTAWLSRFRDNVFVFYHVEKTSVGELLALCKDLYAMGVKVEREGRILDTLIFRVTLDLAGALISLRLKPHPKGRLSGPDPDNPAVHMFLRSFVPQVTIKSYRFSKELLLCLVALHEQLMALCLRGYPVHWILRSFVSCCKRHELPDSWRGYGKRILREFAGNG